MLTIFAYKIHSCTTQIDYITSDRHTDRKQIYYLEPMRSRYKLDKKKNLKAAYFSS